NTVDLQTPSGAEIVNIVSTSELKAEMDSRARDADIVIMSAAVSDYRPASVASSKMKKGTNDDALSTLHMTENPDILKGLVAARERAETSQESPIGGSRAGPGDGKSPPLELALVKFQRKG